MTMTERTGNGQTIGYIRVSTVGQNPDRQLDGYPGGLHKVFEDTASAGSTDRPQLQACMEYLREGDRLVVHGIDRLARNLRDLLGLVTDLNAKGVDVEFWREGLVFEAAPGGNKAFAGLMLQMMGAFAEFERNMIRERQAEGIARAKQRGAYKGRKPTLTREQVLDIKKRRDAGEPVAALAREFGVSRTTIYDRTNDLRESANS